VTRSTSSASSKVEPDFLTEDHAHEHDEEIGSTSRVTDEPLDERMFSTWIRQVTQTFGADILRMKGIIAFKDDPDRFVVQGVHMLIEGDYQRPWKSNEQRRSRLVFIGRDLPEQTLRDGFTQCHA
jgi:G3E family GTPase